MECIKSRVKTSGNLMSLSLMLILKLMSHEPLTNVILVLLHSIYHYYYPCSFICHLSFEINEI